MSRSVYHCGIEIGRKRVANVDDRIRLSVVEDVFGSQIYTPHSEIACRLSIAQKKRTKFSLPSRIGRIGIGKASAAVSLNGVVELPLLELSIIRKSKETLPAICKGFRAKSTAYILLHVGDTVCSSEAEPFE